MSRDRTDRYRDRSREHDDRTPLSGHTNSNDPKSLMSRVFIGNLPHEKVTRDELLDMFSQYGKVTAVNLLKGFGFVQYEHEDEARMAVAKENGTVLKGQTLDIKMAHEGKKKKPQQSQETDYGERNDRSYRTRSPMREREHYQRDRPVRDSYGDSYRNKDAYDEFRPRTRDPYLDTYANLSRRESLRDPYAPVARDPYAAAVLRDAYHVATPKPAPPERPPVDCEITVLDRELREYADGIDRRLKTHGLLTFVNILPTSDLLSKAQDDISKRGIPFNIVVSAVNQQHRSITVRILHGTPQEHRNMPLEDALKLVASNFEAYQRNLRSGVAKQAANEDFIHPDGQTSYLLHLLADNRFLTLEELNTVLKYLNARRDSLMLKQGATKPAVVADSTSQEAVLAQQQQELQAKILSVLGGGSGDGAAPANSSASAQTSALQQLSAYNSTSAAFSDVSTLGSAASALLAGGGMGEAQTSLTSTNGSALATPGVQRALDNLMSNSGGLLQNLSSQTTAQDSSALYQGYNNYPAY